MNEISKLRAKIGDDGPELCYHGIVEALKKCEIGSQMYIFTNAPAKDAYLKSISIQLAREKRVAVTLFCGRSDHQEQISDSSLTPINDDIEYLDDSSSNGLSWLAGGVTMGIDTETLNATENYIVQRLNTTQLQRILLAKNLMSSFAFDVDPTMKSLCIEVTSTRPLRPGSIELNTASDVRCSSTLRKRVERSFSDRGFTAINKPASQRSNRAVRSDCVSEFNSRSRVRLREPDRRT